MGLEIYGASDVGCVRRLNEDCFCIYGFAQNQEPGFCILADGMGGHNAGEVASQCAVRFVAEDLQKLLEEREDPEIPQTLIAAIDRANEKIYSMACDNPNQRGMGTTVVVACLKDREAYIANVGDSRAYASRGDELIQITRDHSVVAEMVANGTITKEEARNHPQKNIITRALGTEQSVNVDIFEYDYSPGDTLLLCSDGLSGMVTDAEIKTILDEEPTAEQAVRCLIDTAREQGGLDNITVICIRFL